MLGGAVSLDVTSDAQSSEPPSRPLTPEENAGNATENAGNAAENAGNAAAQGGGEEGVGVAVKDKGAGEADGQGAGLQAEWQQFDDAVSIYVTLSVK